MRGETEKAVVVRVELAGVRGTDVGVSIDGEWLRIRGQRRAPADNDAQRSALVARAERAARPEP